MCRNLSETCGTTVLLKETGFKSVNDDLFSSFDNVLSGIVLLLFFSPFGIFEFFVGIKFSNLFFNDFSEFDFFVSDSDFFISDGDFFFKFSGKFSNSGNSGIDFGLELSKFGVTLFL